MAKKLKSDIIKGNDGELALSYYKVKKANGKIYVEAGLSGNYAQPVISEIKKTSGSWENHFGRFYDNKTHAQDVLLPMVKDIVKRIDSKR